MEVQNRILTNNPQSRSWTQSACNALLLFFLSQSLQAQLVYPNYPKSKLTGNQIQDQQIKQGEYLAKAGDCIACHTDPKHKDQPFAGGLGVKTPFGTLYSANITADKKTGIGLWNDQQFIRAMQHGIAPNGSYYYPVFPFPDFTKVNKSDLLAIKAYLFSIPPVHKRAYANEMFIPFNWRFLQLGWRILFFRSGDYKTDLKHSALWNRGAYLVQGLGHCGMCHTPLNALGAEKKSYYLTGGFVDGYYAPNISADGLKNNSVDEIIHVFLQSKKLNNAGVIGGPMLEVNHDSLSYLNRNDLRAIAIYLKTVTSKQPKAHTDPITANTGKKLYGDYCAVCHNNGSAGAPKLGDSVEWDKRNQHGAALVYQRAINGFNSMPAKGTCISCSNAEIQAIVNYMLEVSKPGNSLQRASKLPPVQTTNLDPMMGRRVYKQACARCHNGSVKNAPKLRDRTIWKPLIAKNMDYLIQHTLEGYGAMPPKGDCRDCSNTQLKEAVKYMVDRSKAEGDYHLW